MAKKRFKNRLRIEEYPENPNSLPGFRRTVPAKREMREAGKGNTKYDPKYHPVVIKKLALLGLSQRQISKAIDITERTLSGWLETIPEVSKAMEQGGKVADSMVASALFERAIGFSIPEEKIIVVGGQIHRETVMKYYPASVDAARVWLSKRMGDARGGIWGDGSNRGGAGQSGGGNTTINNNTMINVGNFSMENLSGIDLGDFSDEEISVLLSAGVKYKALSELKRNQIPLDPYGMGMEDSMDNGEVVDVEGGEVDEYRDEEDEEDGDGFLGEDEEEWERDVPENEEEDYEDEEDF